MKLSYTDELYIAEAGSPRQQDQLRRAALDWGTVFCEAAAVDAIAAALVKRGAKIRKRGNNGSWYGKLASGDDVRIADHAGKDAHAVEIVIHRPMTRREVWRLVAEELRNAI